MLIYRGDSLKALLWTSQTGEKNNSRVLGRESDGYNQISIDNKYSTNVLGIVVVQVGAMVGWMNGG